MIADNQLNQQGILLEYAKRRTAWNMPALHFHDHYEIYYLLEGSRIYFIDNRQYFVNQGDIVLLSKKVLHRTTILKPEAHSRFALYFTDEFIPQVLRPAVLELFSNHILTPDQTKQEQLKTLFFSLLDAQRGRELYQEELLKCRLFELLLCLTQTSPQPRPAEDFSSRTTAYMKDHLSEQISLSSAARYFSFSPSHFSRRFKEETGVGFQEYLTNLRMKHAAVLLEETDLSITEVSAQCGFLDSNYFSSVFRRFYQVSPREYRTRTLHPKPGNVT